MRTVVARNYSSSLPKTSRWQIYPWLQLRCKKATYQDSRLLRGMFNPLSPTGDYGNMTPYSRKLIRSAVATDSFSTLPQKVSYI